jgi:dTDP-4-dehydrorhamnose reductase
MTWVVIGGSGQLGQALAFVLGNRGIAFQTPDSGALDVTSNLMCNEYVRAVPPTVVINAAAWTDVDKAESEPEIAHLTNSVGALNLALAAKASGCIFAQVSTDYVFSGVSDFPWQEDDIREPVSVYGSTKAAGEIAVLHEYPDSSYIFRTAWLYSQWGTNFAKTMTRIAIATDGEVRVVNDQVGQPTSALDLANQIVESILTKLPFGIYHATNSGQGSWFDFAKEVFELSGTPTSRVVPATTNEFIWPAKRPAYSVLGHNGWTAKSHSGRSVSPMREWRMALREDLPAIITAVKSELTSG